MLTAVLAILLLGTLQSAAQNNDTYTTKKSLEKMTMDIQTLNDLVALWLKRGEFDKLPPDTVAGCSWKRINSSVVTDGYLIPGAKTLEDCQNACERTKDCTYFDWVPCHQLCYLPGLPTAQRYELTCTGLTTVNPPHETKSLLPLSSLFETDEPTIQTSTFETDTPTTLEATSPPPPTTSTVSPTDPITSTMPPTFPPVCKRRMDLAFIVDGSGSICNVLSAPDYNASCENWDFNLKFIHGLIERFVIGPDDTRVALIKFATTAKVEWTLDTYTDKKSLLSAVDRLSYPTGMTNTADALHALVTTVFTPENGDRPYVPNRGILITDGDPNTETIPLHTAIKEVHRSNIKLLVVGVTNYVKENTLKRISSPPQKLNETYFLAKDYSTIDFVGEELLKETCVL